MKTNVLFEVLIVIIVLCILVSPLLAQPEIEWERTYGGERDDGCLALAKCDDGGYLLAGYAAIYEENWSYITIIRCDENGDSLWSRSYGDRSGICNSIIPMEDGSFVLGGNIVSDPPFPYNFWLLNIDNEGDSLWFSTIQQEDTIAICYSIIQSADNGYLLIGEKRGGGNETRLEKTNHVGEPEWSKTYEYNEGNYGHDITKVESGGLLISGRIYGEDAGSYGLFIRTDEEGNEVWSRTYGEEYTDYFNCVIQTSDGGFIAGGCASDTTSDENYDYLNFWVLKTDSAGEVEWSREFGEDGWDSCDKIIQTSDGGFLAAGVINETHDFEDDWAYISGDIFLIRMDAEGEVLWSLTSGGDDYDSCTDLLELEDGSYILAGITESYGNGSTDFYLVKTSPDPVSVPKSDLILSPSSFTLSVYPNPFNSSTTLRFTLPVAAQVSLRLYDLSGRELRTLVYGKHQAGDHHTILDAANMSSGLYFVRLETAEKRLTSKVIIVR